MHDMTINFFLFFLALVVYLLRATTHIIDGLPAWSILSHMGTVLKGLTFGSRLLVSFLSKGKNMAKKYSQEMGDFWSTRPKALIRVILKYHDLRDLCFWLSRGFWQAWSCSKSWCISNYQLSVPTQIYFFVCLTSREFPNYELYGQLLEQVWSKGSLDFLKLCPLGHHTFYSNDSIVKESVY